MYKRASRAMLHAHRVNAPLPTGGYIGSASDAADVLPDVSALTIDDLRGEQRQLRSEVLQAEQLLAVAKISGDKRERETVGQRKVALTLRLSAINKRLNAEDAPNELSRFMKAAREIVGNEVMERIVARSRELRCDRDASLAEDAKRLSPEGVAARAEGIALDQSDTPNKGTRNG